MPQVFLVSGSTNPWTVPANFTAAGHTVEMVGTAGRGSVGASGGAGGGGGGGAYRKLLYSSGAIVPGVTTIAFTVVAGINTGANPGNTVWQTATNGYICNSGQNGNTAASGPGGATTSGAVGSPAIVYSDVAAFAGGTGGAGGASPLPAGGGGGGGAGGPLAAGGNGSNGSGSVAGAGGGANNGTSGNASGTTGGQGSTGSPGLPPTGNSGANGLSGTSNTNGTSGASGTDFNGSHGVGGGGAGGPPPTSGNTSGAGGAFGGGSGGPGRPSSGISNVGTSGSGLLVITYVIAVTAAFSSPMTLSVSDLRAHSLPLTAAETFSIVKAAARSFLLPSANVPKLGKAMAHSIADQTSSTVTLSESHGHNVPLVLSIANGMMVTTSLVLSRMFAFLSAELSALARVPVKQLGLSINPGNVLLGKSALAIRSFVSPTSPAALKRAGKLLALSDAQTLSIGRVVGLVRGLLSGASLVLSRGTAKSLGLSQPESLLVRKAMAHSIADQTSSTVVHQLAASRQFSFTSAQTLSRMVQRVVNRSFAFLEASTLTMLRRLLLLRGFASAQVLLLANPRFLRLSFAFVTGNILARLVQTARRLALSSAQSASISHFLNKVFTLVQAELVKLTRASGRALPLASPEALSAIKAISTTQSDTTASTVHIQRGIAHTPIALLSGQALHIARGLGRQYALVQVQAVGLSRAAVRTVALVGGQLVALVKRAALFRSFASGQLPATLKTVGKGIGLQLGESATLARVSGKRLVLVQAAAVSLARGLSLLRGFSSASALLVLLNRGRTQTLAMSTVTLPARQSSVQRTFALSLSSVLSRVLRRTLSKALSSAQSVVLGRGNSRTLALVSAQIVSVRKGAKRAFGFLSSQVLVSAKFFRGPVLPMFQAQMFNVGNKLFTRTFALISGQTVSWRRQTNKLLGLLSHIRLKLSFRVPQFVSRWVTGRPRSTTVVGAQRRTMTKGKARNTTVGGQ